MKILVLNSGSSSLKYQLIDSETEEALAKGIAERIGVVGGRGRIVHETADGREVEIEAEMPDHDTALDRVFALLTDPQRRAIGSVTDISAVGHRVVHGGERFTEPTVLDEKSIEEIDRLSPLAPLHNPPNLEGIRACMRLMSGTPQVAVFDTAFHATIPDYAYTYALPYAYYTDYSVRRYGFHGTSHRYVAAQAQRMLAELGQDTPSTRVITCHLGNGCSMTAIVGGRAVDTSMGMTPAEGLMMGTRSGDIDPAIPLYLQEQLRASPEDMDDLINRESGLLGVSGITSDMRDLQEAAQGGHKRAQLALSIFCYRIKKYIGAYTAAMGGLDALVFTGGIGENSADVRARVCDNMAFLGIDLDARKNSDAAGNADISKPDAPVRVFVIPTNEERMIARETAEAVS